MNTKVARHIGLVNKQVELSNPLAEAINSQFPIFNTRATAISAFPNNCKVSAQTAPKPHGNSSKASRFADQQGSSVHQKRIKIL